MHCSMELMLFGSSVMFWVKKDDVVFFSHSSLFSGRVSKKCYTPVAAIILHMYHSGGEKRLLYPINKIKSDGAGMKTVCESV